MNNSRLLKKALSNVREDKQAPVVARRQSLCQAQGMTEHKGTKEWIGFGLGLGEQSSSLYRACGLSSCLTHQGHSSDPHGGFIGREFTAEYGPLPTTVHAKPDFLDCSGLSWYSMQICDPPIMVARLYTSCGGLNEWNWPDFPYAAEDAHVYTTIYDRDGITMGLVYDTAAAILRPFAGLDGQDPNQGWEFLLHYGIDKGDHDGVLQRVYGSDESDDDAEDDDGADHFGPGSLEHGALRYDSQKTWDHNGIGA